MGFRLELKIKSCRFRIFLMDIYQGSMHVKSKLWITWGTSLFVISPFFPRFYVFFRFDQADDDDTYTGILSDVPCAYEFLQSIRGKLLRRSIVGVFFTQLLAPSRACLICSTYSEYYLAFVTIDFNSADDDTHTALEMCYAQMTWAN
jgi:hypothetical protein